MTEKERLRIARSIADALDRLYTGVTAACVVATLLGSVVQGDSVARATWSGLVFFAMTLGTAVLKAILDMMMANAEEADDQ
ncbi:hypothetical protein [Chromohalobacter japonicus]|uniref:hypothetical protein n=1 Tax=Chromohalobacter japonicus TaxID=223900 RepID=UPI001FF48C6E|nr:hypothetical protein [Chromohalobacter japonicus]MCK0754279.1 hypothetical protein [Chromohalobacter japonicus]